MEKKQTGSDPYHLFNEEKKRDRVTKRMLNAYRRRKREEKVEKLKDDPTLWKGLQ